MRIAYETTVEDMIAFNRYYLKNAPDVKRSRKRVNVIIGVSGIFALALGVLTGGNFIAFGLYLLWLVLFAAMMRWMLTTGMERKVRKLYSDEAGRGKIGAQTMEITDNCLIQRSEYNESKVAWGMITSIESSATHTFIYTGKAQGYIIPHHTITEGSLPAFLQTLGQRYQPDGKLQTPLTAANAPRPNLPPGNDRE